MCWPPIRSTGSSASATPVGRRTAGRLKRNAHPHRDCTGRIVVVHNGIIENYLELKHELIREGHKFVTETDTEVVAHLVERKAAGDGLEAAVRRALTRLRGLFALVMISADDPDTIVTVGTGRRWSSVSATASTSSPRISRRFSSTRATSSSSTISRSR
jgi:glutamine phosphoribosylpyrophosphate amidotransferase